VYLRYYSSHIPYTGGRTLLTLRGRDRLFCFLNIRHLQCCLDESERSSSSPLCIALLSFGLRGQVKQARHARRHLIVDGLASAVAFLLHRNTNERLSLVVSHRTPPRPLP
ncbi:unnamed protein product, partial [Ectocarpus sp. 8 AP-2014]